jgi:DnaJ-class molecular chaperone
MEFKDYYATLGVAKAATAKEVKQAYRKLARKFHPDVNPGDKKAEARFKDINEAYEVLGDPEKRKKYDELGANWRMYEQAQQAGGQPHPGAGPGQWTVNFGGRPGGFRTVDEEEMRRIFGDEDPFSDFFKTFFGGMGAAEAGPRVRGGRASRARVGHDLEHEIELSLEDALRGTMRRLSLHHDGETRTFDVKIPAGVGEGSRVRVAGEGAAGTGGGPAGDLYLRVRVRPHPQFERRGRDLHTRVAVPVTTAVLGGEASVATLGGEHLRLKIPAGTQNGQVFRLKSQGMPAVGKPDDRGDLFATVDIQVPRELTAEQRRHYEALARLDERAKTTTAV